MYAHRRCAQVVFSSFPDAFMTARCLTTSSSPVRRDSPRVRRRRAGTSLLFRFSTCLVLTNVLRNSTGTPIQYDTIRNTLNLSARRVHAIRPVTHVCVVNRIRRVTRPCRPRAIRVGRRAYTVCRW